MYLNCTITSSTGQVVVIARQLHNCRTIGKHVHGPINIVKWTVEPHIDILEFQSTIPQRGSDSNA